MNVKWGIVLCPFDGLPCNMIFSTVDKIVCFGLLKKDARDVPTMYVCGRRLLRPSLARSDSERDKVVRDKLLEVAFHKCSDLCFFDHEKCDSVYRDISLDYPNNCAVLLEDVNDKSRFSSPFLWFCVRVRFENSSVSVGEALVREGGK